MKRKILTVLILSFCLLIPNIKAKFVLSSDIENNTYIIGKYMFTRTPNEENNYKGELSTPLIMLAAQTTEESLDEITIYYKNLFGEWKNGLTNETIEVPEYFEIENRNLRDILPTPELDCLFDVNRAKCTASFNYEENGVNRLVYSNHGADTNVYIDGIGVEFYLIKNATGKFANNSAVRYFEGGTFKGYSPDEDLVAVLDVDNKTLTENYDRNQLYHVVSRYYYTDGEEKIYSEYSNIVSNGAYADFGIAADKIGLEAYVNTDYQVNNFEAFELDDVKFYNVKFKLTGVDTTKYMIKEYDVYSNLKANDSLSIMTNLQDYDQIYLNTYIENIYKEKYTQAHRFGGGLVNEYFVTKVSGANMLGEYTDVSNEIAYSNRIIDSTNHGTYLAKYTICTLDQTKCYSANTLGISLDDLVSKRVYGDANEDGEIDSRDSLLIEKYLSPDFDVTLTKQGLQNADVNNDGKVNYIDPILIARYAAGWYENTLPDKPITDYKLFGDANEDEIVDIMDSVAVLQHLSGEDNLTEQGIKNADVNDDGQVNDLDSILILQYESGWYDGLVLPNSPITNYTLYGDVNNDGVTNGKDTIRLSKYLDGTIELSEKEMKNADVNGDGTINQTDYDVLMKNLLEKENIYSTSPLS